MRFVLVHGGFHAGWCWSRTIDELNRLGHDAVAVDLPGHGARAGEDATMSSRAEAVSQAIRPGDVVVGHSGGGFDASLGVNAVPDLVSHVIFLAAGLPREGRSYPEAMTMRNVEDGDMDGDVGQMLSHLSFDDDGAMRFAEFDGAWQYFCHDCDEATARWAFAQMDAEYFGETTVLPVFIPDFWKAALPRSFIRCEQDRSMPRWLADTVVARLGVEPLTIDTSHSPFLSRPRELAELMVHATTTQPIGPLLPD